MIRFFSALTTLFLLGGCASVSVTKLQSSRAPRPAPSVIWVEAFAATDDRWAVDRSGHDLQELKQGLQQMLQLGIVEELKENVLADRGIEARVLAAGQALPEKGWLIRGRFLRVNQGSRALRLAFGLGAGGTKVETAVEVFDLARSPSKPFLKFETTGGSNAEPGAVSGLIAMGPLDLAIGVAVGAASVASHGLTEDVERTAYEICAQISETGAKQGWIKPEEALTSKKLQSDTPTRYLPPATRHSVRSSGVKR